MKANGGDFERARRTVWDFCCQYGPNWADFPRLAKLDPQYANLTEKRWPMVVRGETNPRSRNKHLTISLARLIDNSLADVLRQLPSCHKNPNAMAVLWGNDTGNTASDGSEGPEGLASDMISLAGRGHPGRAFSTLCDEFGRTVKRDASEGLPLVRAAIFVANRYLPPARLASAIEDKLLEPLTKRSRQPQLNLAGRGQVIAQAAFFFLDHGRTEEACVLLNHQDAKSVCDADAQSGWAKAQMLRGLAWVSGAVDCRPRQARAHLERARELETANNRRSIAITESSIYQVKCEWGPAWNSIQPYYSMSRGVLVANHNRPCRQTDVFHHFLCVLRGAICRAAAREVYPREDAIEDVKVMSSILNEMVTIPVDVAQPVPISPPWSADLEAVRTKCIVPTLSQNQVDSVLRLVKAIAPQ